jgi:putative ABC transport system substrate-binding protein
LVRSFDRTGGNITGVTMLFDPLTPKKLQLLHELLPAETKIGFLINPNNQNASSHRDHAERAAAALNLRLVILTVGRTDELDPAFAAARNDGIGALLVGDDPLFDVLSRELVEAAARHKIPTMYYVRDFVIAGGLISYGPSFDEMAKQVGVYLARILKGERAAELPVQQPTQIELVINHKTAKASGIAIPRTLLTAADKVIE